MYVCCMERIQSMYIHAMYMLQCIWREYRLHVYRENTEYMYMERIQSTCMLYGENAEYMYVCCSAEWIPVYLGLTIADLYSCSPYELWLDGRVRKYSNAG